MRVVLETLRLMAIFYISLVIFGVIINIFYLFLGIDIDKYGWTVIIAVSIFMFLLYRNRGWGNVFNRTTLLSSISLIILLAIIIPDRSPELLHTTKYIYSYGFPFNFITLYNENGTNYLIPNLFLSDSMNWNISPTIFINFILIYIVLYFIMKKILNRRTKDLVNN